jgi:hypothetical protein
MPNAGFVKVTGPLEPRQGKDPKFRGYYRAEFDGKECLAAEPNGRDLTIGRQYMALGYGPDPVTGLPVYMTQAVFD